jgi:hypothetical protein
VRLVSTFVVFLLEPCIFVVHVACRFEFQTPARSYDVREKLLLVIFVGWHVMVAPYFCAFKFSIVSSCTVFLSECVYGYLASSVA